MRLDAGPITLGPKGEAGQVNLDDEFSQNRGGPIERRPIVVGGQPVAGKTCQTDDVCSGLVGGRCLRTLGSGAFSMTFNRGYCTRDCQPGANLACGSGAACMTMGNQELGYKVCARTCTQHSQCRVADGYECRAPLLGDGSKRYCLPPNTWPAS